MLSVDAVAGTGRQREASSAAIADAQAGARVMVGVPRACPRIFRGGSLRPAGTRELQLGGAVARWVTSRAWEVSREARRGAGGSRAEDGRAGPVQCPHLLRGETTPAEPAGGSRMLR